MVNSMQFLLTFGIGLLVFGLAMTFGAEINEDVREDEGWGDAGCNTTNTTGCADSVFVSGNTSQGLLNAAKKQGTLGTIGVAVVIIGLLVSGFGAFMGGQR